MPHLYDPLLVIVYANEAVQALLKGDMVNVIVNQNNTNTYIHNSACYTPPLSLLGPCENLLHFLLASLSTS